MSGIRGKDTRPELLIRLALHRLGFRYRLHNRNLPGRPDLVLPRYGAAIQVHGCFWHGHDCHLFKWPSSRVKFWRSKIEGNRARDALSSAELSRLGWRTLTIWECALKGRTRRDLAMTIARIARWIRSGKGHLEIRGTDDGAR